MITTLTIHADAIKRNPWPRNLSILTSLSLRPILQKNSAIIASILADSLRRELSTPGVSERRGSLLEKNSLSTCAQIPPLVDQHASENSSNLLELVRHGTYYDKRGREVRKHSSTAKYPRNSVAEARDLGVILACAIRGSTAGAWADLAFFAHLLCRRDYCAWRGTRV
jgi:hypothetical protein